MDYPKKPGFEKPETAAAFAAYMHASLVDNWLSGCRYQVYLLYVEGFRSPPSAALAWGTALDRMQLAERGAFRPYAEGKETEDGYYARKMAGRAPDLADTTDLLMHCWEQEAAQVEEWETPREDIATQGREGVALWHRQIAPTIEPQTLHPSFNLPMEDGSWCLRGSMDLTVWREGYAAIRDIKTSARRWNSDQARERIQTAHYSVAAAYDPKLKETVNPNVFEYEVHVKTKTPVIQEEKVTITEKQRETYLLTVADVRQEMMAAYTRGIFRPNRQGWRCSRRLCAFWQQCEKEWGGQVKGVDV